jgi:hypothetical protein
MVFMRAIHIFPNTLKAWWFLIFLENIFATLQIVCGGLSHDNV